MLTKVEADELKILFDKALDQFRTRHAKNIAEFRKSLHSLDGPQWPPEEIAAIEKAFKE